MNSLIQAQIEKRVEEICNQRGGELRSRQVRALLQVLVDEMNKIETRLSDLENHTYPERD